MIRSKESNRKSPTISSPGSELAKTYRAFYHRTQASIHQARLLSTVAGEILIDFPRNLPDSLKERYKRNTQSVLEALDIGEKDPKTGLYLVEMKGPADEKQVDKLFRQAATGVLIENALAWGYERSDPKEAPRPTNFERVLLSQQLAMLFTYLDAFLADTIRTICRARPEELRKQEKMLSWQNILAAKSIEHLRDELADIFAYELGRGMTVSGRLKAFQNQFKLGLSLPKADVDRINKFEKVRDIVVHNGGRVSVEFVHRTKDTRFGIGTPYPITKVDVEQLSVLVRQLCGSIFYAVSVKFLNQKRSNLSGIFATIQNKPAW